MPIHVSFPTDDTEFKVGKNDFAHLEVRDAGTGGFHFFYDKHRRRLIKDFILDDRAQTALMCRVTLIRKEDGLSPRLGLWIKDKQSANRAIVMLDFPDLPETRQVKASVSTETGGHREFWQLIAFIQSFSGVNVPSSRLRVIEGAQAEMLATLLKGEDKPSILEVIRSTIGSSLTEADISLIANRKRALNEFHQLLTNEDHFTTSTAAAAGSAEAVWQFFFEQNQWIFGYGLRLIATEAMDEGKLERYTTGANIFGGGGKRSDAIMRSRGYVSTLLFAEIKTHKKELLASTPYRKPDIYRPSAELSGSVAQVQKTARKALRQINTQIYKMTKDDGTPTGVDVSTSRPRQVVVIGHLSEFKTDYGVNGEMVESFELFRTSILDTEILTFDELYERARFIVATD